MKVTILDTGPEEEDEIIIRCSSLNEDLVKLINRLKQGGNKLTVYQDNSMFFVEPEDVFYFEAVDQKVFAYCSSEV